MRRLAVAALLSLMAPSAFSSSLSPPSPSLSPPSPSLSPPSPSLSSSSPSLSSSSSSKSCSSPSLSSSSLFAFFAPPAPPSPLTRYRRCSPRAGALPSFFALPGSRRSPLCSPLQHSHGTGEGEEGGGQVHWSVEDLELLSRKELQDLAKQWGIRANKKNEEIRAELLSLSSGGASEQPIATEDNSVMTGEEEDQKLLSLPKAHALDGIGSLTVDDTVELACVRASFGPRWTSISGFAAFEEDKETTEGRGKNSRKIMIMRRGGESFVAKALRAQSASDALLILNSDDQLFAPGDPNNIGGDVKIPVFLTSKDSEQYIQPDSFLEIFVFDAETLEEEIIQENKIKPKREKPEKKIRELVDAERADASAGSAERPTAQPREDTRAPIGRVEERRRPAPMEPGEERRRPAPMGPGEERRRPAAGSDMREVASLGRERAPREARSSSQMPMDKPSRRDREPPAERRERVERRPGNADSSRRPRRVDRSQLEGVTLKDMVTWLATDIGYDEMFQRTGIRCFGNDPSLSSSLKFLRKKENEWGRKKIEDLYLEVMQSRM